MPTKPSVRDLDGFVQEFIFQLSIVQQVVMAEPPCLLMAPMNFKPNGVMTSTNVNVIVGQVQV